MLAIVMPAVPEQAVLHEDHTPAPEREYKAVVHAELPAAENMPCEQLAHVVEVEDPIAAEKVPAPQLTQLP